MGRGKRKRRTVQGSQPTTNKFWSQIGKNDGNNSDLITEPEMNDLTEDTSPANPMEELSKKNIGVTATRSESQENTLQITTTVKAPNIYYMKSENQSEEKDDAKAVVEGRASDIKLVVQNKSQVVKLQSTSTQKPKAPTFLIAGKPIQSRITRGQQLIASKGQNPKKAAAVQLPLPTPLAQPALNQPQPAGSLATPLQFTQPILQPIPQLLSLQFAQPIQQPQPAPKPLQTNLKQLTQSIQNPPSYQQISQAFDAMAALTGFAYPKGIPKSFLVRPSSETPEPYKQAPTVPTNLGPAGNWQPISPAWQPIAPTIDKIDFTADVTPTFPNEKDSRDTYSPTEVYDEQFFTGVPDNPDSQIESPDPQTGQKRQSAFERLGPVAEQPKKPKLTINLLCNSEQSVREVVDETEEQDEEKYTLVHLRKDIATSTDDTVMKYLIFWPWKKKIIIRKTVTNRFSKSTMILEREQMEEYYEKNNQFFKVSVKGYPPSWTKEMVLDALLDTLKGKSFIPCFIEFTKSECKFLVIRCRQALVGIHKNSFFIRKDGVELTLCIVVIDLTLSHLDFIPRTVLKNRLIMVYRDEKSLDLSRFTLQEDVSHFIYYPLNQVTNQLDIRHMLSVVQWATLVELNLSHNRITTIEGFKLGEATPKLKHLDLSFNYLEKTTFLIPLRDLSLRTLKLEGNPLCLDFIDADYYVKVLKIMFSTLREIDGVKIPLQGELRPFIRNYCPNDAREVVDNFLGIYFPLLDASEKTNGIQNMYYKNACMTITYKYKLRYDPTYRPFRTLFNRSRVLEDGDMDSTNSDLEIANLISKWPPMLHDPTSFTIDVLLHDDNVTIFKVSGIVRLKAETLMEDEPILSFSKTFVLHSRDGVEYKIRNEMIYWEMPTKECARNSFKITAVKPNLSIALESPPDDYLKEKLIMIFMEITKLNRKASERCLEVKSWNLKIALDYFMQLLKLDDLDTLYEEIKET